MSERDNFGPFLVGFLVGGITGAVISLLYAPQSGEKTRAVIKEKAIELVDKTTDTLEDTYKKAEEAAKDTVQKAQVMIKKAGEKTTQMTEKGKISLEEAKEQTNPKKAA
jgi:gas vesicle protein